MSEYGAGFKFDTPLYRAVTSPERPPAPTCEREEELRANIAYWDARIIEIGRRLEKRVESIEVCGLICLRNNPMTGKREVLLVNGMDRKTGVRKPFWQFQGGKVEPGEDRLDALHREIKDESGFDLSGKSVSYLSTYAPKGGKLGYNDLVQDPEAKKLLVIHAFIKYFTPEEVAELEKNFVPGASDVDTMEWTSEPFVDKNGEPRLLTEQTDAMLRYIGFDGPPNANTCPDSDWDGYPPKNELRNMPVEDLKRERAETEVRGRTIDEELARRGVF